MEKKLKSWQGWLLFGGTMAGGSSGNGDPLGRLRFL